MKRILQQLSLWLLLAFFPVFGLGQEQLTIGGPWSSSNPDPLQKCPIGLFHKNSISQVIYTQEELSELSGNMITALSYTLSKEATKTFSNVDIYIGKMVSESFSESKFMATEGMEKVGTVTIGTLSGKDLTLPLENPYLYDGSSNLIVCMIKRNDPAYENLDFESFNNGTSGDGVKNQCIFAYTDGDELNVSDISAIDFSKLSNKVYGTIRPITTFTYEKQSENAVLKLVPEKLDFGWCQAGKSTALTFKVTNPGKQTLTINSVTIPEGLGTISPEPENKSVVSYGEQEFTFTLTAPEGIYNNKEVVFSASDAEPNTANLNISALVYPQTALLESFEAGDDLPVLFRNRTGNCSVTAASGSAYAGERCVEFDNYSTDTLIFPKMKGRVYLYLKKNSNYSDPTISVLQSPDLIQWSALELNTTLTIAYQQVFFDLPEETPVFFALAGKGFSIDYSLIMNPVRPTHDLNLVSWTIPETLKENTKASISVVVDNWGSQAETVTLELVDQANRVLAQKTGTVLAAGARVEDIIEWTPSTVDRGVETLQCRIVLNDDEDLTNQYSSVKVVKVVPYLPVGILSPKTVIFEPLVSGTDTVKVTLSNQGIAPLEVSALTVAAPFSVEPATSFTVNAGESQELKVVLHAGELTYVQADTLKITYNGGILRLPIVGTVLTEKTLFESFEGTEWPPLGWRTLGSTETTGWSRSQLGAKEGSWYVIQKDVADTLVTPKLDVMNIGQKLLFWAKSGEELSVLYSADLKNWKELRRYGSDDISSTWNAFWVEFPEKGEFYVGFAAGKNVCLDYIQGPEIVINEKDLRIVGIPVCPKTGNKYADVEYEVYVQNIGSLKAEGYKVQLLQGEKVLNEQVGEGIDYLDTARIRLVYLPLEEGLAENLSIKVVYEGDIDLENNVSDKFNLFVRPEFYGESVVGTEDPTVAANRQVVGLWVSNYDYSLQEFHYSAAQLGIKPGSKIKTLSYLVCLQDADIQTPLNVWIGKNTNQNITTAWSSIETLTSVYNAETIVPKISGEKNTAWGELEFSEPYLYEGGDLVIMVERNGTWKNINFLTNQATDNVHRYYRKDSPTEEIRNTALAEGSHDRSYPTLRFIYDLPSIKVSGTVKDENGNTVAGADISLTNGEVVYRVVTDENGRFELDMSRIGMEYEISIIKESLFFAKETIEIGTEDMDLGDLEMIANPLKISLVLNGGEGLPMKGSKAEMRNENNKLYRVVSTGLTAIDTLVFENLKAGLYSGKVTHPAYKDTAFEVRLTDNDTVLAFYLIEKEPISVSGKVLSSHTGEVLAAAEVCLKSLVYDWSVCDITDTEGIYQADLKVSGKYIRTINAFSYESRQDTIDIPDLASPYTLQDVTLRYIAPPATNGTLTVKVTTDNGESPAGAEIYLMNDYTGVVYNEWVDASGQKAFSGLSFGEYRFGVYKEGFLSHEEMLSFTADRVLEIELKEQRIAPYALTAEVVYNADNAQADIAMEWNNIGEYYYDGFEEHEDFSIDFKPWTLIDVDGKGTASIRSTRYPHLGEPIAAMVFNPYTTTPPCTNTAFAPLTGTKYLTFFNAVGGPSNDWAIAPKRMIRKGDMLIFSFRHLEAAANPERFTICVSNTGTDPEDFTVISQGNYISSEAQWMTFTGDMSSFAGEELYVAIHYESDQTGGMLMIDDFFIGAIPDELKSVPAGKWVKESQAAAVYKVYMDGELKETLTDITSYTFSNVAPGTHTVGVSQVYKGGESMITTAEVVVEDFKTVATKWELRLSTNTGISCQDAQVSLTDTAGNSTLYTVDDDNKVIVNYLRYGDYTLRVAMAGYDPVVQSLSLREPTETEIELKESLTAPSNLFVDVFKSGESYYGTLTWNTMVGFNESFESYADFTQEIGQWTNIDRDGLGTFGLSNCSFPGMGEPLAAVVYNPSATTPSTGSDSYSRPHSGNKEIIFFSTDQGTPDDWLISPKQNIRDNYQLRFFAKSYSNVYGLESLSVLVSETDLEQASFKEARRIVDIPTDWMEYVVDLSGYRGKDIYIAFRYTQANTFFLLLDDIYVGPATDVKNGVKTPSSYNVYLDGKLAGTVTEAEFVFKNLEYGRVYEAGVEAVYASGVSERSVYSFKVENVATEQPGKAVNTVSVYPNPVRSGREIHLEVQTEQDYTVRFFNAYGRLIWETGKMQPATHAVRLPEMPSGMYIIEVQTQEGVSQGKLMIL